MNTLRPFLKITLENVFLLEEVYLLIAKHFACILTVIVTKKCR